MKIFDISIPLNEKTPVWPGDANIKLITTASRTQGTDFHVSKFSIGAHNGTHIDAPYHFWEDGNKLQDINISHFVTKTLVIEYSGSDHISEEFLKKIDLKGIKSILLKTSNSKWINKSDEPFHKDFIAIDSTAANWCVKNEIKLIGIDYFSIEQYDTDNHEVHKILLRNNVIILEAINLSDVPQGDYQLFCPPLKIAAPDGAPVRAILVKD
jgi:arylformamidase